MAGNRNFNGAQVNQSVTIVEQAGENIADCRNRIMAYDTNGDVVPASDGTQVPVGVALIEAGVNDISGAESGKVEKGDDVDIQIKDIGYVFAGEDIAKGDEITAGTGGAAVKATSGSYVLGIALGKASKDGHCRVQIVRYQKAGVASSAAALAE